MKNKGEMNLSFGMIFSIIMIIIFVTFAFYAIQKFLGFSYAAQTGKFTNDLQRDVDGIWQGSEGNEDEEYIIPGKIKYVCFLDFSSLSRGQNAKFYDELKQIYFGEENMFFYPVGSGEGFDSVNVKHVDIFKTTERDNPLCFPNVNGKINVALKKDFNEALVTIEK